MYAELRGEYDRPAQHPVYEPTGCADCISVAAALIALLIGFLLL